VKERHRLMAKCCRGRATNVDKSSSSNNSVSNMVSTKQTAHIITHEDHLVVIETLFHSFCRDDEASSSMQL
jgi:hypothetical protein